MTLNVYVEKKHFCWDRQMKQVEIERLRLTTKVEFHQKGYEFTYKTEQKMKGTLTLKGANPPVEKTVTFHPNQNSICLEQPGIWVLTPDSQSVKLSHRTFEIDTSVPNEIDLRPRFVALDGKLEFENL